MSKRNRPKVGDLAHCPCTDDPCKGTLLVEIVGLYQKASMARCRPMGHCDRCGQRPTDFLVTTDTLTPYSAILRK